MIWVVVISLQYLLAVEVLGLIAWPITRKLFSNFPDEGWGFSKILGTLGAGYVVWLLASLHIVAFTQSNVWLMVIAVAVIIYLTVWESIRPPSQSARWLIITEEVLFITTFAVWTYLRGFAPDINGLEKFMDYGFMLSILRAAYFPPLDHFLAPETINYYYFGHYLAAFITRLAAVPPEFGYNLQMSMIMALAVLQTFSVSAAAISFLTKVKSYWLMTSAGTLSALLVTLFGNLHAAIYFTQKPDSYWYPDATRFIEYTIHEFPIYSFIVNDLHGHVSSIPLVLLVLGCTLAYLTRFSSLYRQSAAESPKTLLDKEHLLFLAVMALLVGSLYPTNAWDLPIYLLVFGFALWISASNVVHKPTLGESLFHPRTLVITTVIAATLVVCAVALYLPFWLNMRPIAEGIGIVPQDGRSPLWQLAILWGGHVTLAIAYLLWLVRFDVLGAYAKIRAKDLSAPIVPISVTQQFLLIIIGVSFLLILLPEIIFLRDIYPQHYRANTMFKFFYQAWNMLGIVGGTTVVYLWYHYRKHDPWHARAYKIVSFLLVCALAVYPYKAIKQGLNGLDTRTSTNGITYLQLHHHGDYEAISWLNTHILGQPTLLEAVGDSYTMYARVSANTGIPSVLGWSVHEWLWRGSYSDPLQPITRIQKKTNVSDNVAQRVADAQTIYETTDSAVTGQLLDKYEVRYVYIGALEREKYPNIAVEKFYSLGTTVYDENDVQILEIH